MGRRSVNQRLILVVDDEPGYVRAIQINLEARGFQVLSASNGPDALELAAHQIPALILLDLRMPKMDGYETCRRIRAFSDVPVILLTALAEPVDKVKGLEMGADDYVTKPFNAEELVARVRAALRRAEIVSPPHPRPILRAKDIMVDLAQHRVFVENAEVALAENELRVLIELMRQPNRVLPVETLLENIWGSPAIGADRLVWRTINRLRKKIERDPKHPKRIQTHGNGYLLASE